MLTKILGTTNPHNVVNATMAALTSLESATDVGLRRGISADQVTEGVTTSAPA